MRTKDEVIARTNTALSDLVRRGKGTATGIANWLSDHGYTGYRHQASDCPVANYLSAATGLAHVVGPGHCSALWIEDLGAQAPSFELPEPIQQFVRLFDSGVYPDLDRDKFPVSAS